MQIKEMKRKMFETRLECSSNHKCTEFSQHCIVMNLSKIVWDTYAGVVYTLRIRGVTIPPVHDLSALMVSYC